jgi:hypothetical protein
MDRTADKTKLPYEIGEKRRRVAKPRKEPVVVPVVVVAVHVHVALVIVPAVERREIVQKAFRFTIP